MRPVPRELDEFLSRYTPAVRALTLRTRELILKSLPDATETVWTGWKVIGYGTGPGMPEMIYGIAPLKERINLTFTNGTLLDDPHGLLKGTSKTGRHLHIASIDELESLPVRSLIKQALAAHRDAQQHRARARNSRSRGAKKSPASTGVRPLPSRTGPMRPSADDDSPVSDATVRAKTGRSWAEWHALLDEAGARSMSHTEIARLLGSEFDVGPWWRQMLAVGYERARGLRAKHETASGYQVGASRTIGVPIETLWAAWHDARRRRAWLGDVDLTVRKATEQKSMRITWQDGSHVDVLFTAKGDGKALVSVDHRRLPDAARVEEMRDFWKERLSVLKARLET